jgi:TolA-binding protein
MFLIAFVIGQSSCGNNQKVAQLEQEISKLESTISALQAEKDTQILRAQEVYDFAVEALKLSEEIRVEYQRTLNFLPLNNNDDDEKIQNILIESSQIESDLKYLYAPPSTIDIKTSLLTERSLMFNIAIKVLASWTFLHEGNEASSTRYFDEAMALTKEYLTLSQKNEIDLINLKLQAEHDLGK